MRELYVGVYVYDVAVAVAVAVVAFFISVAHREKFCLVLYESRNFVTMITLLNIITTV
jgi:hypothetical protein